MRTALLLAALVLALPAGAQQRTYHARRKETSADIPRLEGESVTIDGVLDDGAWQKAALLTGFSNYLPIDNIPADDSTEVYVWYTSRDVYFGVRAFERHSDVHATLAARDKIDSDDYIQIVLDPFNDRRRAFIFGVNPLGVQADGVRSEGFNPPQPRGQTFGGNPPANIDLSPDFLFESKGRVIEGGYEIELRIPLKSIRFQGTDAQSWALNVIRYVQHTGNQQTWMPTRRGAASFLVQSGTLRGFAGLHRELVTEVNPEFTQSLSGEPSGSSGEGWSYGSKANLGGNVRLRLAPNITLNATVRPDFSQVEADAAQVPGDTRFALFFPERRPFFLDGSEYFDAPGNLMYTRRILQPDAAAKLTGRIGHTTLAWMGALDGRAASTDGEARPLINLLRVRRDLFSASTAGLSFTDRTEGAGFSRVAMADTRIVFRKVYTFNATAGGSARRPVGGGEVRTAPYLDTFMNRQGLRFGLRYGITSVAPDFEAVAGYVPRSDYVSASFYNRVSFYGKPESFVQSFLMRQGYDALWLYDKFWDGRSVQETKVQLETVTNIRGGWVVSITPVRESWQFDERKYTGYATLRARADDSGIDTLAFTPSPRTSTFVGLIRVNTPQFRSWTGRFTAFVGRDVDFFETAPARRADFTAEADFRPSTQLRLTTSYLYSHYARWRDGSTLSQANVPRLRAEYQLTRALFLRVVGQYDARRRDALRDPATNRPIVITTDGVAALASATTTRDFRMDWLVSYVPSPGTVFFAGYGSSLTEPRPFRFRELERVRDGFFIKLSYLLRR
ncbi:MAG: carbohydrate binding family 9 domain-containing protein [Gemmatimonadetes bacterium]|nr:carbohydrate binding family 9 domain-containing protein [Gemmatimonadota bacterium]